MGPDGKPMIDANKLKEMEAELGLITLITLITRITLRTLINYHDAVASNITLITQTNTQ